MDNSKKKIEEKSSPVSENKNKNYRRLDLEKLEKIRDVIVKFNNKSIPLKQSLLVIGKMSAGITVDGEIWKKYCYIKRGDKVNRDGIPFHKMSHFENIFYDRQIYSLITELEFKGIEKEMSYLKMKINRILQWEKGLEDNKNDLEVENSNSNESLFGIIDVSDKYFEILTSKLVIKEINKWETIDFNNKYDRYFISRLLAKIGEFLNELKNDVKMKENAEDSTTTKKSVDQKDFVLKAFLNLVKIRNQFSHNCSVVTDGMQDLNEIINEMLVNVREHLKSVFIQGSEIRNEFTIAYQYKHADKFEEDSEKLLNCLKGKYLSYEGHKNVLHKMIIKARDLFKDEDKEMNKNISETKSKIKNKLKSINKQYQLHRNKMNDLDKSKYPAVLCVEKKNEIIKSGDSLQNCPLEVKERANKIDQYQLLIGEINYFTLIYGLIYERTLHYAHSSFIKDHWAIVANSYQDLCNEFYKERCEAQNGELERRKEKKKDNVVDNDIIESLSDCFNELKSLVQISQLKYEQVDTKYKEKYSDVYDQLKKNKRYSDFGSFKNQVHVLCKETIKILTKNYPSIFGYPKLESNCSEGNKESERENMGTVDVNESPFIKTGLVNNGNLQCSLETNRFDSQIVTECFIKECTLLVREFVEIELAKIQELMKFDYIMQQVVFHVLQLIIDWDKSYDRTEIVENFPMEQREYHQILSCFHKYATSYYMTKEVKSCKRYRSRGLGHRMLDFDRTIFLTETKDDTLSFFDFLNWFHVVLVSRNCSTVTELYNIGEALYKINLYKESIKVLEKALQQAESHPEEVQHEFDQWYMKIIGKPRMICQISRSIVYNHLKSAQYGEMYGKVKEVIDNINEEELNRCDIFEIKEIVSAYYGWIGEYYWFTGQDLDQALQWLAKSESICENSDNKRLMGLIHKDQNEYNKSSKLFESMRDNVNDVINISLEIFTILANNIDLIDANSSEDARSRLDQMESCFENNRNVLKREMREKSFFTDLSIMFGKLIVLLSENDKHGMNEDRFKELIDMDKKFHYIKEHFGEEGMLSDMLVGFYPQLCICYSQVCILGESVWGKDEECLEKAKKHFVNFLQKYDKMSPFQEFLLISLIDIIGWSPIVKDVMDLFAECANRIIGAQIDFCNKTSKEIDPTFLSDLVSEIEDTNPELTAKLFDKIFNNFLRIEQIDLVVDMHDIEISSLYKIKLEAIVDCDLLQFKSWFCQYYELSRLSLTNNQKQRLNKLESDVREMLINLGKVLVAILTQRDDFTKPSIFSIRFCREKFNIECTYENEKLLWKLERVLPLKEIEIELNHIGQMFVIIIFVMGYYKINSKRSKLFL